ncbi:hypothetical protein [Pantoea piersonii]|uniref:hypothetical protein n=1 Tax=Pantoea piersonii TaxID=2364647 RepID=UPI0028989801|nr:hypothetical protein [Pantoea piersonii]
MNPFKCVKVSEGSFFSVKRRVKKLLCVTGLEKKSLCKKSFRTLRRGGWMEFSEANGKRIAFRVSGLATLRLFCSSFDSEKKINEV